MRKDRLKGHTKVIRVSADKAFPSTKVVHSTDLSLCNRASAPAVVLGGVSNGHRTSQCYYADVNKFKRCS